MLDLSWHNIVHSNLINFLIMILILWLLLNKAAAKTVSDIKGNIEKLVNESNKSKENSLNNLEEARISYEKTPVEAAEIRNTAKNTLKSLQKKAAEEAEHQKQITESNTQRAINSETAAITAELTKAAGESSVSSAAEKIKRRLAEDETLHDRLIEKAILDLEKA